MKHCTLALFATLLTITASAEEVKSGPSMYVAPILGVGIMSDSSVDFADGTSLDVAIDPGYVFGGEFGLLFNNFRAGLSVTHQYNTAEDVTYFDGVTFYSISGISISQLHTMLNLYYDFNNSTMLTPYIGGGAGLDFAYVDAGLDSDYSTYFAAQIGAGGALEFSDSFALDLSYKYIMSDDYEIDIPGLVSSSTDLSSHQILLNARFTF